MKKIQFLAACLMAFAGNLYAQSPIQFNARAIVAISDADLSASALIDGNRLTSPGVRDQLTYITLPLNRNGQSVGTANVSNSMALTDKVLAVNNAGRIGFVVEGRAQLSDSLPTIKGIGDFPQTNYMFILDMSTPQKPVVKYKFPTGAGNLNAVSIAPTGNGLIVASGETGKEIKMVDLDATGKPTRVLTGNSPVPGVAVTDVAFHPGGQFVAYTTAAAEVGIMKYAIDDKTKKPYVIAHGKPVKVGSQPGAGKFTPDGKYYVIADSKDNQLFVVELSTADAPADAKIAAQIAVGESPEAVAISPDGAMVAVVSSLKSGQPFTDPAAGKAEVALFGLAGGQLSPGGKAQIEGIMPQAVEFDKTGDNLAVAVAEYLDYGIRNGGIEFYKVTKGGSPALTKQPGRVSVTRGVHTMRVVN
jgi:DNA-binding beta-propeller fold protein YncE